MATAVVVQLAGTCTCTRALIPRWRSSAFAPEMPSSPLIETVTVPFGLRVTANAGEEVVALENEHQRHARSCQGEAAADS